MIETLAPSLLTPPGEGLVPVWQWLLATWFGTGLVAPLRAGLAVAITIPVVLLLMRGPRLAVPLFGLAILVVGIYAASAIELAAGIVDDRRIVIDEVGAFVLGAALLRGAGWPLVTIFAAALLTLDKLKPWPFYLFEALPRGWGVMLDDLPVGLTLGIALAAFRIWQGRSHA